jgi:hypothetical protein
LIRESNGFSEKQRNIDTLIGIEPRAAALSLTHVHVTRVQVQHLVRRLADSPSLFLSVIARKVSAIFDGPGARPSQGGAQSIRSVSIEREIKRNTCEGV